MLEDSKFAYELVCRRGEKGMTQKKLAEEMGVSTRTIMLWESGETLPRKAARIRLAAIFELPCDHFLRLDDIPTAPTPEAPEPTGVDKLLSDLHAALAQSDVSPDLKKNCAEAISRALQSADSQK